MITLRQTLFFVLLTGLVPTVTPVVAQTPAKSQTTAPSDAQVRELQEKIKSLQKQLDELNSAKDAASRQRIMQQNWQGMQDYMGSMHDRWGMGYPWMMGGPRSGNWMGGCPMMGGNASGWAVPKGVDPDQYRQKMREHMQRMQEQMNKIAQTTDPQERQRLLQEHWQSMYQNMQTMRGMGWMWDGYMMGPGMMGGRPLASAKPLPEPTSQGAKLVATYCVQCHAAPQPDLHTAAEWSSVTERMHAHMNSGLQGIRTPTEQEMKTILSYMQKNAQ
jgi:polyhydroxyalkanoate synthesis regulator protein